MSLLISLYSSNRCGISSHNFFMVASTVTFPFRFSMWLIRSFLIIALIWSQLNSNRFISVAEIWYFIKKSNENDKNKNFMMKNSTKNTNKVYESIRLHFLWTCPTDPWCNMLQTLERWRKYINVILSDKHTLNIGHYKYNFVLSTQGR